MIYDQGEQGLIPDIGQSDCHEKVDDLELINLSFYVRASTAGDSSPHGQTISKAYALSQAGFL